MQVRNPHSIRPYQHVLEPLFAYLLIAAKQFQDPRYAGYYNVGPEVSDCIETVDLICTFSEKWNTCVNDIKFEWECVTDCSNFYESRVLKLDTSKIKSVFGWNPIWKIEDALDKVVRFNMSWLFGDDITIEMDNEIWEYYSLFKTV